MHANRLVVTIEATHQCLQDRLDAATRRAPRRSGPREGYARTDAFLAATSRHLAAFEEALLPVLRRELPDGDARTREYLHQARLLELALATLKARIYGAVAASHIPWEEVWDDVRRELSRHNETERALVHDLVHEGEDRRHDELADRLYRAELKAPTRAHPYLPHRLRYHPVLGGVPEPVGHRPDPPCHQTEEAPVRPPSKAHAHDSLMAQYLVGEARFDAGAPVFARHARRH
jgi:hypothetical protein